MGISVEKQILPNNIVLVTESDASVRTAAIGFCFSVGSRYESEGCRGITHFVEHMLFKGTQKRSAFSIACEFDRIGGYANAYTERECVCLYCTVPAEHAADALDVLCDMTEYSVFNLEDIERERSVIQSEVMSSLDDAEESALDAAAGVIWPNSPLAASIAGGIDDIASISYEMLYQWYQRFFVHGMLSVFVSGAADTSLLVKRLSDMHTHAPYCSFVFHLPVWHAGLSFLKAPFRQEQIFALFPIPYPLDERRYFAYAVLNALLGDTMSSRLFQRLREQDGCCYSVYSFCNFYFDTGCWCAYASAPRKNSLKISQGFFEEISSLCTVSNNKIDISDDEISAAKEHLCGEEIICSEETEYRMKRLQRCLSFNFAFRNTDEILSLIRSISKDELIEAIRSILSFDSLSFIIYGPSLSESVKMKIQHLFDTYVKKSSVDN